MKFDELGFFILKEIKRTYKTGEPTTPWIIAKKYLELKGEDLGKLEKRKREYRLNKQCMLVIARIDSDIKFGILEKTKTSDGGGAYKLDLEKCDIGKHKFNGKFSECFMMKPESKI